MSVSRYVLPLFPGFMALGIWIENRFAAWAIGLASFGMLCYLTYVFTHWGFVG
jgi:hypothetical protein